MRDPQSPKYSISIATQLLYLSVSPLSALSAGIGRTGCFIASSICCQQLRETGQVDILETVCQLRLDRWVKKETRFPLFCHFTLNLSVSLCGATYLLDFTCGICNLVSPLTFAGVVWSKPQSSTSSCTPHWPSTAPSYNTTRYSTSKPREIFSYQTLYKNMCF